MDHNAKIAKLQKSISIMNQAMRMSIHDNGEYDGWDSSLAPKPYVEPNIEDLGVKTVYYAFYCIVYYDY